MLFAPWLDLTTTDPGVAERESHDPFLSGPGLAPISVFTGTRDVLLTDSRRLRDRVRATGADIDYEEYPGMFHGWVLQSLPEARRTTDRVSALVGD